MLAFKLLLRNWRSGELKLLSLSLMLAVAVLSGISIFTNRLDSSLSLQSNVILGADSTIESPTSIPPMWEHEADLANLRHTKATTFESMLYAGDAMMLASIKAVGAGFPLRGKIEVSQIPFATATNEIETATAIPSVGEVWLDSRLFTALNLQLGNDVQVGDRHLRVSKILVREPEQFSFNPRLLMNEADLASTKVIQPGGRVDYRFLIASDNTASLNQYLQKIQQQLNPNQRIIDPNAMMENMSRVAKNGKQFLLLSTILAVLLAGVAIAIAARQFSARHTNQVALMKSLGVSAARVRQLYSLQLLGLASIASLLGLLCGQGIQLVVARSLEQLYRFHLSSPSLEPYVLSFISGIFCAVCFALPALWFLPSIPPIKILRREMAVRTTQIWAQASIAFIAVATLIALFSRDLTLTLITTGGLLAIILLSIFIAWCLLAISRPLSSRLHGAWRLAFANLYRQKIQHMLQIAVFATAIMALLTLTIIRSSIMDEWSRTIPAKADNHFLINIGADEVADVQRMLDQQQLRYQPFNPIVRARLTHINGQAPDAELRKKSRLLELENELSWSPNLLPGDTLTEGLWWDQWKPSKAQLPGVSVNAESAKNMGVKIGDHLRFSIAGLELEAEVASLRKIAPSVTQRSFSLLFDPASMTAYTPTYTSSFYLAPEQKRFVNTLLRQHPGIALLELDKLIVQMKTIIEQVTDGVMLVLWLSLLAGGLVILSAVISSIDQRRQENGLLRAFGSSRHLILGSVLIEFAVLGGLAGTVAIICSELMLLGIQSFVLKTSLQAHYLYWLVAPVGSALLLATLGVVACRSVITTPPATVLRGVLTT